MYKNIIDEKADALLMDEEAIDYNHFNLNVMPAPGIIYAVNYLESILSILGKYNPEVCKDLKRQLRSMKLIKQDDYQSSMGDKDHESVISKIVKHFEVTST